MSFILTKRVADLQNLIYNSLMGPTRFNSFFRILNSKSFKYFSYRNLNSIAKHNLNVNVSIVLWSFLIFLLLVLLLDFLDYMWKLPLKVIVKSVKNLETIHRKVPQ